MLFAQKGYWATEGTLGLQTQKPAGSEPEAGRVRDVVTDQEE